MHTYTYAHNEWFIIFGFFSDLDLNKYIIWQKYINAIPSLFVFANFNSIYVKRKKEIVT